MTFRSGRTVYMMRDENIIYIESRRNGSVIHGSREAYPTHYSMSHWISTLSSSLFFRCHESYIVNLEKITEIRKEDIILENGINIPVSRRRKSALLKLVSSVFRADQNGREQNPREGLNPAISLDIHDFSEYKHTVEKGEKTPLNI